MDATRSSTGTARWRRTVGAWGSASGGRAPGPGPLLITLLAVLMLVVVVTSWGSALRLPHRAEPTPAPSRNPKLTTVQRAAVGDRLTITAVTGRVLGPRSFTLRDLDLPSGGLLVLGEVPGKLRPTVLVTVVDTVVRFQYSEFSTAYQLDDPIPYVQYEGRKVVVAESAVSYV